MGFSCSRRIKFIYFSVRERGILVLVKKAPLLRRSSCIYLFIGTCGKTARAAKFLRLVELLELQVSVCGSSLTGVGGVMSYGTPC